MMPERNTRLRWFNSPVCVPIALRCILPCLETKETLRLIFGGLMENVWRRLPTPALRGHPVFPALPLVGCGGGGGWGRLGRLRRQRPTSAASGEGSAAARRPGASSNTDNRYFTKKNRLRPVIGCGRFFLYWLAVSSGTYSIMSPGWQASSLQRAAIVSLLTA
ncbi:hypothetical protein SDC9_49397 [bioreactor metagenome]|uniref:Uncharacterized protein n=1 Tax=bioreactor metagenome TaxID=1076179 RepID=A0A644WHT5_9ZZZZ